MHFFKYGEQPVLAIVLPPRLQKNAGVKEGDDYEFVELSPGAFLLVGKDALSQGKGALVAKIAEKLFAGQTREAGGESAKGVAPKVFARGGKGDWEKKLEAQGYLIVDETAAKELSAQLEYRIKQGEVLGVRGFDKRFYIAERGFYEASCAKITGAKLEKEFAADSAAEASKLEPTACLSVLQIMKETGEAIEKKKGLYKLVR